MPTSRKRHRPSDRSRRRSGNPALRERDRGRALDDFPLLQATDAAEARGDAAAALQLIEEDLAHRDEPSFWRPWRVGALLRLVLFGPWLPAWVTSRWIVAQAAQHLDPRTRGSFLMALDTAIETRGCAASLECRDDLDARIKVMDHDWVFRQLFLYELGALEHFVTRVASPDLLAGADHIHDWMHAPMRAFRLDDASRQWLTLRDLATGDVVTALNLGAACLLADQDCVIGRLVPIAEGAMFESAPLPVPDWVAQQVADDPDEWVAAVAAACRAPSTTGAPGLTTTMPQFDLVSDVPRFLQVALALEAAQRDGLGTPPDPPSYDVVAAAGVAFVRAALEDRQAANDGGGRESAVLATWLLEPAVFMDVASGLTPEDAGDLLRLADRLAGPAASLCHELAQKLDAAA